MGPAPSVPLSETGDHNWILGNIHLKFKLNFYFQSYTYKTHKGDINYCEEDTGLLRCDIIGDCLRFGVENFMILSSISDTCEWGSAIPFLKR